MNKKEIKVCFIGLGSIAKRHIKNLQNICKDEGIQCQIDVLRRTHSKDEELNRYNICNEYVSIEEMPDDYDVVFITNPTRLHLQALKACEGKGKHFFIEKPIANIEQLDYLKELSLKKDSIYYIACPLRYNQVIQYIKENIPQQDILSVRCISSSYLPDWRPGTDYRTTYSANKNMGGGVSIDLIHEWDYITYLYGFPKNVEAIIGKKSALEIDSDDFAIYIGEYDKMTVEIHLDYFGRVPIREIQIFTKSDTIIGNILHGTVTYLKEGKQVTLNGERDDYQKKELIGFMNMINGKEDNNNSIGHAVEVLRLAAGRKE